MNHVLVVPQDLIDKLQSVETEAAVVDRWKSIGVTNSVEMMTKVIEKLNSTFEKLHISDYRVEDKNSIKEKLENSGNVSKYLGYLEKEDGSIDGLFFYNEPKTSNANDIATRNVWPALIGIYNSISDEMVDLHINNRPVYIVNLNETTRLQQRSVKVNILCSIAAGFNYVDVFDNGLDDVIAEIAPVEYLVDGQLMIEYTNNPRSTIKTLSNFDKLVKGNQDNDFFDVDENNKIVSMLSKRLDNSSNPSAEFYRYCSRIVPAAYYAKTDEFEIDIEQLEHVSTSNTEIIKAYLRKFQKK